MASRRHGRPLIQTRSTWMPFHPSGNATGWSAHEAGLRERQTDPREAIQEPGQIATKVREHRRGAGTVRSTAWILVGFEERLVDEVAEARFEQIAGKRRLAAPCRVHREQGAEHRPSDIARCLLEGRIPVRRDLDVPGRSIPDREQARRSFGDTALGLIEPGVVVVDDRAPTRIRRHDEAIGDLGPGRWWRFADRLADLGRASQRRRRGHVGEGVVRDRLVMLTGPDCVADLEAPPGSDHTRCRELRDGA